MTRRRAHMILHWSVFMLILAMVKGGASALWVRWAFVALVAVWVGIALAKGLIGKAGPAFISLLLVFGIGAFHGLFQFWRHGALYDNALHLITPSFMHKHL